MKKFLKMFPGLNLLPPGVVGVDGVCTGLPLIMAITPLKYKPKQSCSSTAGLDEIELKSNFLKEDMYTTEITVDKNISYNTQ